MTPESLPHQGDDGRVTGADEIEKQIDLTDVTNVSDDFQPFFGLTARYRRQLCFRRSKRSQFTSLSELELVSGSDETAP